MSFELVAVGGGSGVNKRSRSSSPGETSDDRSEPPLWGEQQGKVDVYVSITNELGDCIKELGDCTDELARCHDIRDSLHIPHETSYEEAINRAKKIYEKAKEWHLDTTLSTGWFPSVAFSQDGAYILTAGHGNSEGIRIWNVTTGALEETMGGIFGDAQPSSVAFRLDNGVKRFAWADDDATIQIWDAETGVKACSPRGHSDIVFSVAFSPDGTHIVSGGSEEICMWDAGTGALEKRLGDLTIPDLVFSVAFSPDGARLVAAARDEDDENDVNSVAFSPDGTRFASGGDDGTVRVWNAVTFERERTLDSDSSNVCSVAFSPDGKYIVSASREGTVRLWDAAAGWSMTTLQAAHVDDTVISVAFSPDGARIVSAGSKLKIWKYDVNV